MKITTLIENTTNSPELIPEHGLSLFVEAAGHRFLFDTGAGGAFADNAVRLGMDPKSAEFAILSHGHYDHVMGVSQLVRETGAPVYIHKKDQWLLSCDDVLRYGTREAYSPPRVEAFLEDGMVLPLGNLSIKVLHTPGHTAGCCVFLCEDAMFSGDTLFQECCGRTDLETGSMTEILKSLKRLAQLEGNYRVFPGHEDFSSLDYERQYNPYIREAMKR